MMRYVDIGTLKIVSAQWLLEQHQGVKAKGAVLSEQDLSDMDAAELQEPATTGDVATGGVVLVGGVYEREYRNYTPAELTDKAVNQRKGRYIAESDPLFLEALRKRANGDTAGADVAEAAGVAAAAQIQTDIPIP